MDIPADYEERHFNLGGLFYRPDFWLPKQNCWIEIKGISPSKDEREKARRLAAQTQRVVYIFYGPIPEPNPEDETWYSGSAIVFFPNGTDDEAYWWCECPSCGTLGLEFEARATNLACGCLARVGSRLDKSNYYYSPRLLQSYLCAREAEYVDSSDGFARLIIGGF